MSHYTQTLAANAALKLTEHGEFVRLLSAQGDVKVRFFKQNSVIQEIAGVSGGFWRRGDFDAIEVIDQSGGPNALEIVIDTAEIGYDQSVGEVTINPSGSVTQAAATVTDASAQLLAAKANRRFLLVQNKDAAGNVWLNLAGAAATAADGVRIPPGGSLLLDQFAPVAAVFAIGDLASNANIVTVEG